ncbi:hypothetical protein EGR_10472 [Echinococcus granulosus]|uniref:Uncharacterized protein n=1 Tax=Echinococcus granulosus TaxID=6210 RepID=W6U0V0_ECHGR|nr:hypothetical protein EGR_10472 [Echinococcus granulosus]EUB54673.1 hypothetical protein EGR_10472 [Echinococcus granulosus]
MLFSKFSRDANPSAVCYSRKCYSCLFLISLDLQKKMQKFNDMARVRKKYPYLGMDLRNRKLHALKALPNTSSAIAFAKFTQTIRTSFIQKHQF